MEAAGSPIGRGGIPSEGSKGRREDELSGFLALFPFLLLAISLPLCLSHRIFSSPVSWRRTRSGLVSFRPVLRKRGGKLAPVSNRSIIRRSCCYDYAFSPFSLSLYLSISLPVFLSSSRPCSMPGSIVGSARDNAAGTSIHQARPVRAETNDYRKLPLSIHRPFSLSLFLPPALGRLSSENSRYESLAAGQHGLPIMKYDRPMLRDRRRWIDFCHVAINARFSPHRTSDTLPRTPAACLALNVAPSDCRSPLTFTRFLY